MSNNPQIYHGEWWVPAPHDRDLCSTFLEEPKKLMGLEKRYEGTLTYYEDKESTLELYHFPSNFHAKHYCQNDVMWGQDANGNIFTLFNVTMKEQQGVDFTDSKFVVALILLGVHALSLDYDNFSKCIVRFPYLINWGFYETKEQIKVEYDDVNFYISIPRLNNILFELSVGENSKWSLRQSNNINHSIQGYQIDPSPYFEIQAQAPLSIRFFLKQINEFSDFLSIALYGLQDPTSIELYYNGDSQKHILLFNKEISYDPGLFSLIKMRELKEKLPSMLKIWHENFDNIAPISSYLIKSLQKKNSFDVSDFLIIAQALDGYHKRFVNKKEEKDIRKYEEQIKILLNQFKDVKAIEKCHIKPEVLTDSRNYYSHLFPDEEKKSAVEGDDLYWLTEKCKVLLTCCILNMLGLTNKEINLCCENSPISQIIDSLPFEPETE